LGWNLLLAAPLYFIIRQGQPRRPSCRQTGVGARSDLPNDWTYPSTIRVFALWKHSGGGALLPWNGQDIVAAQTSPLEVAFIAVQQAWLLDFRNGSCVDLAPCRPCRNCPDRQVSEAVECP